MTLSRVLSLMVIHLTRAKEVKLNTKDMQNEALSGGMSTGSQRCLTLPDIVLPAGRSLSCSSIEGSRVASIGSQNLITSDMLNHAWAIMSVQNQVPSSLLMPRAESPVSVSIPIAAMIDGMTNGTVRTARIIDCILQSYLPSSQATGRPSDIVARDERMD